MDKQTGAKRTRRSFPEELTAGAVCLVLDQSRTVGSPGRYGSPRLYFDGSLASTSTVAVTDIGGPAALYVLGRSAGGVINIDNVRVVH